MSRYISFCLAVSCIVGILAPVRAVADSGAPPAATRWEIYGSPKPSSLGPGPVPAVYNLTIAKSFPQAIDVDEFGRFYVLDHLRQDIARFTPNGEFDKLWLEDTGHSCHPTGIFDMSVLPGEKIILGTHHWNPDIRVFGPDPEVVGNLPGVEWALCIAAEDDGSYYIYGRQVYAETSLVHAYSPDGKLRTSWKTPGLACMAIGPDGLLYAAGAGRKRSLLVYDTDGNLQRKIDTAMLAEPPERWWSRIALDRNGDIYITDRHYIVRLANDGRPLARWCPYVAPNAHYDSAAFRDVAVSNGVVYAIACMSGYTFPEFQAFTPDGQCIARYIPPELSTELPWAAAAQSDGSYAVEQASASRGGDQILLFNPAGEPAGSMSHLHASHITARPAGGYYLASGYRLQRVDADGQNPVVIADEVQEKKAFRQAAVDFGTGNLWTLARREAGDYEVVVFDRDDKLIGNIPVANEANLSPREVWMAVDPDRFIYFTDTPKHHVVKCDLHGNFVGTFGRLGDGLGELRRPKGITVDPQGRVIVADTRNHRIQVFSSDGEPLGVWGRLGHGDGELDRPTGVALLPGKTLLIADTHNDRVVRVPLSEFWRQITRDIEPPPPYVPPKKEPIPIPGAITVEASVVAGTDDFTDVIYVESSDRAWGMRITVPAGMRAFRNERCRITGVLELKERAARHLVAESLEVLPESGDTLTPLGMANLYVGDGYRAANESVDLSNLGLLVKTWGRVVSVDLANKRFVVNDGSFTGEGEGLEVYGGQLQSPLTLWPSVGQYVAVTGISAVRPVGDSTFRSAIRLRGQEDIEVLAEQ